MQFATRLAGVQSSVIRQLFSVLKDPSIISLAGGFPDSATFDLPGIKQAVSTALSDSPAESLQYGSTEGLDALRLELATWLKTKGVVGIDAGQILVTTGSQQGIDLLGKSLINPHDRVIVEGPTFLAAIQSFRLYGANLVSAPVDEQGVIAESLECLIVERSPKLIYLIPSFGNPSGLLLTLERRKQLLEIAVRHQVYLVEDDPYSDLYFGDVPPLSLLALSEQVPGSRGLVVYCGSLSKVLSPGLRIGFVIANPELLDKLVLCKQFSDAHTSTFAQSTAAKYLASGRMQANLNNVRELYRKRSRALGCALREAFSDSMHFSDPPGGLFIWATMAKDSGVLDTELLLPFALKHRVAFVPGAPFFAEKPDRTALRLSFASIAESQILEGVRRLEAAVSDFRSRI